MEGSVLYKKTGRPAKKAKAAKKDVKPKGNASAKKQAAEDQKNLERSAMAEPAQDMIGTMEDGTPKMWLHDLVQAISSPGKAMRAAGATEVETNALKESVRRAIRTSLHFCFLGSAIVNGKTIKKWSSIRKMLKWESILMKWRGSLRI